MGLTEYLSNLIVNFIGNTGYISIFVLMTMESTFLPVPSEAVMPFAGFLVEEEKFSFPGVMLFSTLGTITGSLLLYLIGYFGGKPFIDKFGRYLLIDKHHLNVVEQYFNKHGDITIFICRFVPVIRHLISLPAGIGKMRLHRFIVFTIIGAGIWNMILAYAGYFLKSNWAEIMKYSHIIDLILLTALILLACYYLYKIYQSFWGTVHNKYPD